MPSRALTWTTPDEYSILWLGLDPTAPVPSLCARHRGGAVLRSQRGHDAVEHARRHGTWRPVQRAFRTDQRRRARTPERTGALGRPHRFARCAFQGRTRHPAPGHRQGPCRPRCLAGWRRPRAAGWSHRESPRQRPGEPRRTAGNPRPGDRAEHSRDRLIQLLHRHHRASDHGNRHCGLGCRRDRAVARHERLSDVRARQGAGRS